ncbi:F0F1 ATP synthase subunit epsilon [Amphibiibacter pelophylacis]|uniref:F0F1 ATP synthase subunit epsilon n=1 Tax=Amphibiibacter pelophylacis TaxID=1799477 RepID=A0ACC6P230_9BURK
MATLHVDVVSTHELIFSGEATRVVLPGESGELGILPRHTPLITRIKPGSVRIQNAQTQSEELIFVQGGILEVQPGGVTVLADTAIRGKDLDEAKALEAKKAAEAAIRDAKSEIDLAAAQSEFAAMAAQLAAIQKLRRK